MKITYTHDRLYDGLSWCNYILFEYILIDISYTKLNIYYSTPVYFDQNNCDKLSMCMTIGQNLRYAKVRLDQNSM